ncbi:MAG: TIGR03960 family B12-binding radical SAM protein [Clostridiaceae bacterium]|nr:TIGR03960 family B12-binding radical SAM protein [Clostridiaceae bacterium]
MRINLSDDILLNVKKPAKYTGNEWNMVRKNPEDVDVRFAFCFPDDYEIGMSHLGMKILYHILNKREDTYCERVFAPWTDMEEKLRKNNIPLFSLETYTPLSEFDMVGFTLQYEMSYTNILNMLDLGGIPVLAKDRKDKMPFVLAGGPCAVNPEPLADFIDFFVIGEGEEVTNEIIDEYKVWKSSGESREEFLIRIAKIEGIYVPGFYDVDYNEDGTVKSITPNREGVPSRVKRRIIEDLDKVDFPEDIIVPYVGTVHDRIMLEIFRGCIRGCRFCQAGFIYRPLRERSYEKLLDIAKKSVEKTGYEEISLVSLSTSDYSKLPELCNNLIEYTEEEKVNLSLPSLRLDNFSLQLMEKASKVRKSGLTFAPEAGSQRLRDVINKGITEEDLFNSVKIAVAGGWNSVKLYFMMGLPTETMEDVEAIGELGIKLLDQCRDIPNGKSLKITLSTSCFVPKPFTPFQWEPMDEMEKLMEKQLHLKNTIRKHRKITYNYHDAKLSMLEAVLARGDRRTGQVLYTAWKKGCKFDGWAEFFDFNKWMEAFEECGLDPEFYANRRRSFSEVLPWDHINIGVTKRFLQKECEKAYKGEVTRNCSENCSFCGAQGYKTGICFSEQRSDQKNG